MDNPAANTANTTMGRFTTGQNAPYIANPLYGRTGRVTALLWRCSTAITAGSLTLQAVVSSTFTDVVTLTSASGTSGIAFVTPNVAFLATNGAGVRYRTDSAYLPVTNDWAVDVLVEYAPA